MIAKADLETEVALPIVLLTAIVTLAITDAEGPVEGTTNVVKKGAEIGSGEEVTAEGDGTYILLGRRSINFRIKDTIHKTKGQLLC